MANHQRFLINQWIRRAVHAGAVALALVLFQPGEATGAPPKPEKPTKDLSVKTEILDLDSGGQVSTIASDGVELYENGIDGVSSILTANVCNGLTWGDWRFDTRGLNAPAGRFVNEGFFVDDLAVAGEAPAPYEGHQAQKAWMNVQCTCTGSESGPQDMYTMTAGQTMTCPLLNNFNDAVTGNGWGYAPAYSFTGFPETTDARITCNSVAGGHCADWFIDPIGAPSVEAIGRANESVTTPPPHPRSIKVNHGSYFMRFRIHVSL